MNSSLSVKKIAKQISTNKKNSFWQDRYKAGFLKNLAFIKKGSIIITDQTQKYCFGKTENDQTVNVRILSQDFYSLIGSAGILGAAEAYTAGYWKTDNLLLLTKIILRNQSAMQQIESGFTQWILNAINRYNYIKCQNTLLGSKKNILAHYDLSNAFYQLWLDPTMTYSAAFFKKNNDNLEDASKEKLDRICRKLNLQPSDRVVEIGSGWGSFAIHAAKNYHCHVTTTTISDAQYQYTAEKIKKENLENKITLLKTDYRKLQGTFDKLVSIEMIEAVGYNYIAEYFRVVASLLKPDGLMALQAITYNDQEFDTYKESVDLIKKYIFPGSCLVSINHITDVIKKKTDLAMVHLEDITSHYVKTLKHWRNNFLNALDSVRDLGFSENFINLWEFYLVYCEAGFSERHIGDVQIILAKTKARNLQILC